MIHSIGIGEVKCSAVPEDVLITYSLGSCIGVTIYDPEKKVGGLIHCALPMSKTDPQKAAEIPAKFVDTGIPLMFEELYKLGAQEKSLVIKVAGGSNMINDDSTFKIGKRNYSVLRKLLWKNNLLIEAEDVGGCKPRTMTLHLETGRVTIKSGKDVVDL